MSTESLGTPGFYGKLPSLGDFVSRNLPRSFIDPWDSWLQHALADSRSQLGEQWLSHFLNSPVWRFLISSGSCGNDCWAGVFIPSVDRVGRYFPLTLCVPLGESANLLAVLTDCPAWFADAETLILTGLDDHIEIGDFAEKVENLGKPITTTASDTYRNPPAAERWHCLLSDLSALNSVPQSLTRLLLHRCFPEVTVWWTEGATDVPPCLLLSPGMPPPASFAALLTGDWQQGGWGEVIIGGQAPDGEPAREDQ